jgi:hypothetical protein
LNACRGCTDPSYCSVNRDCDYPGKGEAGDHVQLAGSSTADRQRGTVLLLLKLENGFKQS